MPELVELKIMSEFINTVASDTIFNDVYKSDVNKNHFDKSEWPPEFKLSAKTKGKELQFLIHEFDNFNFLIDEKKFTITMGMSGNWTWVDNADPVFPKHGHLFFKNAFGVLVLEDPRRFAKWKFRDWNPDRGPDPTTEHLNFVDNITKYVKTHKDFKKPLVEIMFNQKWFNGLGAYLIAEIIGRSKINPFHCLYDVYQTDILKYIHILDLCKSVPEESYILGGGQFKDWINPIGTNNNKFLSWLQFYNNSIKCNKIKLKNGRSFWCSKEWL